MSSSHFEHGRGGWSAFRVAGPCLIDGWPWGLGAQRVGSSDPTGTYVCTSCRRKRGMKDGPLWYPPGTFSMLSMHDEPVCAGCARDHIEVIYNRAHLALPIREQGCECPINHLIHLHPRRQP